MRNEFGTPDERHDLGGSRREPEAGRPDDRPAPDREVPLPGASDAPLAPAVQAWLDGEGTEAAARRADEEQVAFWARIGEETARRRRLTTPAHLTRAIMEALPEAPLAGQATTTEVASAPVAQLDGRIQLTPAMAVFAAAALVATGIVVGLLL